MPRVKRGVSHVKRRKNILARTKGYRWGRKNLIRLAKTAITKAGAHAYFDRRKKKSDFRKLWNIQINAACRLRGFSYSQLIDQLSKNKITINRKMLADLGQNNTAIFDKLIEKVKK